MANRDNRNNIGCRVKYCSNPQNHTTYYHRCKCGKFGHGEHECTNIELKNKLKNFWHETLPENQWCPVNHCRHKKYHTKDYHYCSSCGRQGHDYSYNNSLLYDPYKKCLIQPLEENIRRIGVDFLGEFLGTIDYNDFFSMYSSNVYITDTIPGIRILYIRKKLNRIESLLLDLDQDNNLANPLDIDIRDKFIKHLFCIDDYFLQYCSLIDGIDEIDELDRLDRLDEPEQTKKCPICRCINKISDCKEIKGLSEKCKVCFVSNVEILYSICKHACVCKECYLRLN